MEIKERDDFTKMAIQEIRREGYQMQLHHITARLLENCCFVLLTNRAPPQISDNRPDMRQRALLVTSRAAWRWNKRLLVRENVDSPLAAMVVATEHNAL